MSGTTVAWLLVAVVLVFWAVGAHNRLVALRNEIVAAFVPLDEQYRLRQLLLREHAGGAWAANGGAQADLEALQAALAQADAACAHARLHPGAAGAITSLRLAEEVLASTRARLPTPADAAMAELATRIAAGDAALQFTRQRFNAAVADYNVAVRQFPTWLLAAVFGFRAAATL